MIKKKTMSSRYIHLIVLIIAQKKKEREREREKNFLEEKKKTAIITDNFNFRCVHNYKVQFK